jgi:hypothetical protein
LTREEEGLMAQSCGDGPAHDVLIQHDNRGVIVWCSCNRWGYTGPDEDKALDAYRAHIQEKAEGEASTPCDS